MQLPPILENAEGPNAEYSPRPVKKMRKKRRREEESFEPGRKSKSKWPTYIPRSRFRVGQWNYRENQIYLKFMLQNSEDFASESQRRRRKVFFRLSKELKRRTADQCRSHHQKMQMKYREDLSSIIAEVYCKIQKGIAQEIVDQQHRLQLPHHILLSNLRAVRAQLFTPSQDSPASNVDGGWFSVSTSSPNCFRLVVMEEEISNYLDHL